MSTSSKGCSARSAPRTLLVNRAVLAVSHRGRGTQEPRPSFLPLFTRVRGREILRSSHGALGFLYLSVLRVCSHSPAPGRRELIRLDKPSSEHPSLGSPSGESSARPVTSTGHPATYTGGRTAAEGPSSEASVWAPRAAIPHHPDARTATDTAPCAKSLPTIRARWRWWWRTRK